MKNYYFDNQKFKKQTVDIVFRLKAISPNFNKSFGSFLDYENNPRKQPSLSSRYKNENFINDIKTNIYLFSKDKLNISLDEKRKIKKIFNMAQQKNGYQFNSFLSFSDDYLKSNNLIDENNVLNEKKIKTSIQEAVKKLCDKENIIDYELAAVLHYNTNNLHAHIVFVEKGTPSRTLDKKNFKFSKKNLLDFKSNINKSLDLNNEKLKQLDVILKQKILKSFSINIEMTNEEKDNLIKLYKLLPDNKTVWQYNNKNIKHLKNLIRKVSLNYLENHFKDEFNEIKKLNLEIEKKYQKTYGKTNMYSKNKMEKEIIPRVANAILKELKNKNNLILEDDEERKNIYKAIKDSFFSTRLKQNMKNKSYKKHFSVLKLFTSVKKIVEDEHIKNQKINEKLEFDIKREKMTL